MGTGAKVAIGCGCVVLLGAAAAIGVLGAGAWWAKGKIQEASVGLDKMTAVTEEIERYEKQANANAYSAPPDGVIPEARFLKFIDTRKQVYAVYERHETELRELQRKAERPDDKLTLTELWSAGGSLAGTGACPWVCPCGPAPAAPWLAGGPAGTGAGCC